MATAVLNAAQNRVLLVQPTGLSGIWHYANSLARALQQIGFDVALATQSPYENLGHLAGGPVYTIGPRMQASPTRMPRTAHKVINHGEKLARLSTLLLTYRPGIVHLHAPLGGFDCGYFRAIRGLGARVIYTAHDARPLTREATWFDWARYRAADHVLVHSRSCAEYLTMNGVDPRRVSFIPHGNYSALCIDGDLSRESARRSLGLKEESRVVLFFGAISPYKGLETLLAAFPSIARRDSRALLVLAGEPLMDAAPILAQIDTLGIRDKVLVDLRYIPFAEFARYFRSADVVVFPHRRISQSGVLMLAYGFGRPVVATDVGGLGEAVNEDGTGIVVPPGDVNGLAAGIVEALSDPARAEAMGMRARALSESKYSWGVIGDAIARVYRSVQGG